MEEVLESMKNYMRSIRRKMDENPLLSTYSMEELSLIIHELEIIQQLGYQFHSSPISEDLSTVLCDYLALEEVFVDRLFHVYNSQPVCSVHTQLLVLKLVVKACYYLGT